MSSTTCSCPAAAVRATGSVITLGNSGIELGFDQAGDGALVSILDPQSGCELRRDRAAPNLLWRLALRRGRQAEVEWHDSRQAAHLEWTQEAQAGAVTLTLRHTGLAVPGLAVTVAITLPAGSALSTWRVAVSGIPEGVTLAQVVCPVITGLAKAGDPAPGETLVAPIQGEGYLFRDPFPVRDHLPLCSGPGPETADVGVGRIGGRYPGSLPMQMFAFYNDQAGLYLATHDAGQNVKEFSMAPWEVLGPRPVLAVAHFPGEEPAPEVALAYDTLVGVFHGDWYAAADLYKAWATRQWWCRTTLWERDIATWLRTGFGVFQMSNFDIPVLRSVHPLGQIAEVVNTLSASAGTPLLALVFNWEGGGAWTGPRGFFPPREGEAAFREAMAKLRAAGNYGFVYITGGQWYIKIPYEPPFDSWEHFRAEGRPHAIAAADGTPVIHTWTAYGGWESARLCPHTAYTRDLTAGILVKCVELGCPVVQIDNFPCGGSEACYDPTHGHPLGPGPWWAEAWGRILAEARRQGKAADPECAIATEGIAETFIPWLDLYDHRAGNMEYFGHYSRGLPMGGETIPLFNYVYHPYIGSYCAAYPECNRPEVLYWTRCLGKALAHGVVPTGGRYFKDPPEHNPVTIGFYRRVVRAAAHECWPYLMFGEMLRPPRLEVPQISAQYCKFHFDGRVHHADPLQRHEVRDAAVQHAVFRGRDGSIGYLFVNIAETPVDVAVDLDGYGTAASSFDLDCYRDGDREAWRRGVALPRREGLHLAPLSVTLVTVRASQA